MKIKNRARRDDRPGFTLIELLLSLALIVVATGLIGFIMQMYSRNFTEKGDDIRRKQLARALLGMIADDIRAVVLEQEYDGSVLEQQLSAGGQSGGGQSGGGQGGGSGGQTGTSATGGGAASGLSASGGSSLASGSSGASSLASSSDPNTSGTVDDLTVVSTAMPLGIYGDQYTLRLDVSRVPRADEYLVQQTSMVSGTLDDVPGDIKTVLYYVQADSIVGVADDMQVFSPTPGDIQADGYSSGLVRRALDRAITAYAEEIGDTERLSRSGDLVAPEVIALEFAYFDGSLGQWVYEWDSSQQSLPWLIQISLGMQSENGRNEYPLEAGTLLSSLSYEDQQVYGVEVYELVVAIPGAILVAADAAQQDSAAGMDSLGL